MVSTTDLTKITFRKDFQPRKAQLVMDKGRTLMIAFESSFNGRDYFNIRDVYEQYGEWCPGKSGIQVPMEQKEPLLNALQALISHELKSKVVPA